MSKLARVAHCQSESALTWHPPAREKGGGGDTVGRGGGEGEREGCSGRETKKLHVSARGWQLMRCTIIVFNWRGAASWQRTVDGNLSSSSSRVGLAVHRQLQRPRKAFPKQNYRGRKTFREVVKKAFKHSSPIFAQRLVSSLTVLSFFSSPHSANPASGVQCKQ